MLLMICYFADNKIFTFCIKYLCKEVFSIHSNNYSEMHLYYKKCGIHAYARNTFTMQCTKDPYMAIYTERYVPGISTKINASLALLFEGTSRVRRHDRLLP